MKKMMLAFLMVTAFACAQNQMQQDAMNTFISNFNQNDFEKIYESFSPKMQQARAKSYYLKFFSQVKKDRGNLRSVEITNYTEIDKKVTKAQYLGHFDYGSAIIRITMNAQNQIIGFYIKKENLF